MGLASTWRVRDLTTPGRKSNHTFSQNSQNS